MDYQTANPCGMGSSGELKKFYKPRYGLWYREIKDQLTPLEISALEARCATDTMVQLKGKDDHTPGRQVRAFQTKMFQGYIHDIKYKEFVGQYQGDPVFELQLRTVTEDIIYLQIGRKKLFDRICSGLASLAYEHQMQLIGSFVRVELWLYQDRTMIGLKANINGQMVPEKGSLKYDPWYGSDGSDGQRPNWADVPLGGGKVHKNDDNTHAFNIDFLRQCGFPMETEYIGADATPAQQQARQNPNQVAPQAQTYANPHQVPHMPQQAPPPQMPQGPPQGIPQQAPPPQHVPQGIPQQVQGIPQQAPPPQGPPQGIPQQAPPPQMPQGPPPQGPFQDEPGGGPF